MTSFARRLTEPGTLVADGAMGTMLFLRGLKPGDCPERWNLERPEALHEIALSYLAAGARILQTNTFGASPLKLAAYGLEGRTEEINARGVEAARRAAGDRAWVVASCGPSGRILRPYGDTAGEEVFDSFQRQAKALAGAGVDAICVETMTDLAEAVLAIRAAKTVAPDIPVLATMTFDQTPRGFFTIMGVSIEAAAKGLAEAGADAIGSNCGNGIQNLLSIAEEFRRRTALPVAIRPNAGIPRLVEGVASYPETPEAMADGSRELAALGVRIIGGCCGTTPRHIAAMAAAVDAAANRTDIPAAPRRQR